METLFCPGCAGGAQHGGSICPVCGAPCVAEVSACMPRNPFRLIALCLLWTLCFWLGSLVLLGEQAERQLGGSLLLASIGLSIALTVRGLLPGTRKPLRS